MKNIVMVSTIYGNEAVCPEDVKIFEKCELIAPIRYWTERRENPTYRKHEAIRNDLIDKYTAICRKRFCPDISMQRPDISMQRNG